MIRNSQTTSYMDEKIGHCQQFIRYNRETNTIAFHQGLLNRLYDLSQHGVGYMRIYPPSGAQNRRKLVKFRYFT